MAPTSPKTEKVESKEVEKKEDKVEEKETAATEEAQPESSTTAPVEASPIPTIDPKDVPREPDSIIDVDVLEQIREMDDMDEDEDEDEEEGPRAFSRGIVFGYFDQAENTFNDMANALAKKDLPTLSSLGHFLKGSSAAVGVIRVQAICERIQHYGHKRDEEENTDLDEAEALDKIQKVLTQCKKDYALAKAWLIRLYEEEEEE